MSSVKPAQMMVEVATVLANSGTDSVSTARILELFGQCLSVASTATEQSKCAPTPPTPTPTPPQTLSLESMSEDEDESDINPDTGFPYVYDCSPPTRGRIESYITSKWTDEYGKPIISQEDLDEKIKVALEETPHAPCYLPPSKRIAIARAWGNQTS